MHEKDKEGKDKRDREIRVVVHLLLQSTLTIYSYLLTYSLLLYDQFVITSSGFQLNDERGCQDTQHSTTQYTL